MSGHRVWLPGAVVLAICTALLAVGSPSPAGRATYRSPFDVAFSPDGRLLAVSDRTADEVTLIDAASGEALSRVAARRPAGLVWAADGARLYAAAQAEGRIVEIDPGKDRAVRRLKAGARPTGLALVPGRRMLVAANGASRDLSIIDLARGEERARLDCGVEPFGIAITPDERWAIITHLIPAGDASDPENAASLHLLDLESLQFTAEIPLPSGATAVRELVVSPDGRWAYVAHTLGRFNLPTTQLDRGWVNTNAVSIVDLAGRQVYATLLLDVTTQGAADPWGLALAPDGSTLWITLSGAHQLARLDLGQLHPLLAGGQPQQGSPSEPSQEYLATALDTWAEIRRDPEQRELLRRDLTALYAAGLLHRLPLDGKGPRGLDLAPGGDRLAAAMYFSGNVALIDPQAGRAVGGISLGPQPEPEPARRGEMLFHDGVLSFQHWLSCATCHPEGRADGLNWDLLNDGMGNPKNTRSLLLSHRTPPAMSQGVRDSMEVAAAAGFRHILFREPDGDDLESVQAYIRSLEPEPSPYRSANGKLSGQAQRGEQLFHSPDTRCSECHPSPLFTDLQLYDVGTRGPLDSAGEFDTPTLIEVWRTPPYLHDGRARTIRDVLTTFNVGDRHGRTSHLTEAQLKELAAYVLSL